MARVLRSYAGMIHAREQRTGHFWQGRVGCVAMDEAHLAAAPGEAHACYARRINFREGWRRHRFQARLASYPIDDAHWMVAARCVENDPSSAGMVARS